MSGLGEIKNDHSSDRRWFLRYGALALPFFLSLRSARAVERVGSVQDLTGEAFAESGSGRRTLDKAAPVFFLSEEVVTGAASRLEMRRREDRISLNDFSFAFSERS
jgi:hypothetical protein